MISAFTEKYTASKYCYPQQYIFFYSTRWTKFCWKFSQQVYNKVCLISRDRKNPKYSGFNSFVKGFLEHLSALLKRKSTEATIIRTTVSTYSSISNQLILIPCSPLTDLSLAIETSVQVHYKQNIMDTLRIYLKQNPEPFLLRCANI